jgi:phosphohistidine swiveling domain-containing protein
MTGPASTPEETPAPLTATTSTSTSTSDRLNADARSDAGAGAHLVVHALRVKQVATVAELAAMTSMATGDVERHLASCEATGDATLRVRHQLWQLTPEGMARHARWLADEAADGPGADLVRQSYADFLPLNVGLKDQCGQWQLRHGQPNDHGDLAYDAAVIEGLGAIDRQAAEVLAEMSAALPRFAGYRPRRRLYRRAVRLVSRRLDGAPPGLDRHAGYRPSSRGLSVTAPLGGERLVFSFDHPHEVAPRARRDLLGAKGANLAEMTSVLGLPVPPGFTISTEAGRAYLSKGWPETLDEQVDQALTYLEGHVGRRLGDPDDPLLVSVRSGASDSMPGMLDTVLDVGINDDVRRALATRSDDEGFAWDCQRRFLTMYGRVVLGRDLPELASGAELPAVRAYCRALLDAEAEHAFPREPRAQLMAAVRAVFTSWHSPRARAYRQREGIDDAGGTAVNVQAMVFGNRDARSGSGVAYTRDPSTGARRPRGDFLWHAQGEDVVAGTHHTENLDVMAQKLPDVHRQLRSTFDQLEEHFADACEVEFTIESARLWILQVRRARNSGLGAIRLAIGLANQSGWSITREEAVVRVTVEDLEQAQRPQFENGEGILATGLGASPGAAVGHAVFSAEQALDQTARGLPVILVRDETSPADVRGMQVAEGVLTSLGGMVSHAAVVARGWGIPAVVGAPIDIAGDQFFVGEIVVRAGDVLSIDGVTGAITRGARALTPAATDDDVLTILSWADAISGSGSPTAPPEERLRAARQRLGKRSRPDPAG